MWTAKIICEGEDAQEATGEFPDEAVLNLLADIMESWKRGEYSICGDYIKELGEAIVTLERRSEDTEFESQCGDFSEPWKLVVTRDADPERDEMDYEREECEACEGVGCQLDGTECPACQGYGDIIIEPCQMLGGGCTCESCTAQITDALGM